MIKKITIKEVVTGVPALVVEYEEVTVVHDPFFIADAIGGAWANTETGSEEETALSIAQFLFNHMGELLQSSNSPDLYAAEDEEAPSDPAMEAYEHECGEE